MKRETTRGARPMLLVLIVLASPPAAQSESNRPDFSIQGEYRGVRSMEAGDTLPMGVQVSALGGQGRFRATLLCGGLPGQGWDGKEKAESTGSETKTGARFFGGGYDFSIDLDSDSLRGTGPGGANLALEKVLRVSNTEGAPPPAGARVLFNGSGTAEWDSAEMAEQEWLSAGGSTKKGFEDCFLHLEFRLPYAPEVPYGNRGNSGFSSRAATRSRFSTPSASNSPSPKRTGSRGASTRTGVPAPSTRSRLRRSTCATRRFPGRLWTSLSALLVGMETPRSPMSRLPYGITV